MFRIIAVLLALHTALAQFQVSQDKQTYGAGDSIQVDWSKANPSTLKLDNQDIGQVLLCSCISGEFHCSNVESKIDISKQNSYTFTVASVADMGPNGYYAIQFATKSSSDANSYTVVYSHSWFQITSGMTGTGTSSNQCTIPYGDSHAVPGTASTSIITWTQFTMPSQYSAFLTTNQWSIPYTWQKGATRFAPAQSTPSTRVTQSSTPTRRFPTSSFTAFKSYFINKYLPITTVTPGPVSKASQQTNWATTIATTPSGSAPARVLPTLSLDTSSQQNSKGKRRVRRWAD